MASGQLSREEALTCSECRHACHVMLYSDTKTQLFGRIPIRHIILMQMRFDGLLGFPGGLVNPSEETLEAGLSRELRLRRSRLGRWRETAASTATDHGLEVLGMVRVPLYTMKNGGGLGLFLSHAFISATLVPSWSTLCCASTWSPPRICTRPSHTL
ncbi:U8 snoRNA-decapping enzyme-like protein [Lates japonicus]|uniref:U8 snoRNA-decapping enzyme-like protein n=1 Tax=Lates japonicus TaxID=270547 RepID=A0AAD3M2F6_LATJO|nr:U8 snoRNA-decapping enzyme-like protein [Lates japonicus]